MAKVLASPITRIFDRTKIEDCWLWTGQTDSDGYGQISIKRKMKMVHRLAYEYFNGEIPVGLELDHKCRVRNCLNPNHLEPVTHQENCKRGNLGGHGKNKKVRGDHEAWCTSCQDFLLKENFSKNRNRWNGLHNQCKKCRSRRS